MKFIGYQFNRWRLRDLEITSIYLTEMNVSINLHEFLSIFLRMVYRDGLALMLKPERSKLFDENCA